MSQVAVKLAVNVIGCGNAGDIVSLPSTKAARLVERGRAAPAGRRAPGNPSPSAPPPVEWPENSGITVTRPQLAEIAKQTGVKVDWIEAAAKRIAAGDAVPTAEVLAAIASRAALRKEVLALAEAYVIHAEMAARFGEMTHSGAQDGATGDDGDLGEQDDAGDEGGAQGDVGAQDGPSDEDLE